LINQLKLKSCSNHVGTWVCIEIVTAAFIDALEVQAGNKDIDKKHLLISLWIPEDYLPPGMIAFEKSQSGCGQTSPSSPFNYISTILSPSNSLTPAFLIMPLFTQKRKRTSDSKASKNHSSCQESKAGSSKKKIARID